MTQTELRSWMAAWLPQIEKALDNAIPHIDESPATLHKAMRHSLFAGGKRLRPLLVLAAYESISPNANNAPSALAAAAAVEMLHTYSLIHDDLPCMDDDDYRRGKPTCHKVYGENIAVLAGDALQAQSFLTLTAAQPQPPWSLRDIMQDLTLAAGPLWLVGGQVMDLEGEGSQLPLAALQRVHERKTGALLRCSAQLGGKIAGATPEQVENLSYFGMHLGLAFQVIDDILDVTQSSQTLGKTAGKDDASEKSTYPAIVGLDASKNIAQEFTAKAHLALDTLGSQAVKLRAFADLLLSREF